LSQPQRQFLRFPQRQLLPRIVLRLCAHARETLSVFAQALSPAAGGSRPEKENNKGFGTLH
jgi:hypothetical protein